MTVTAQPLPMILDEVEVVAVERLSPSFVRVVFGGPALAGFGVDGPLYDQRIKLVFPGADGRVPSVAGADESWFDTWLARPEEERGHMRTYTVREVRGSGADTRLVVDLVLHLADGATGPGSRWAAAAVVGDRVVVMAPRRGEPFGGIEFAPGDARRVLLAGDETAVPAICAILRDLPSDAQGAAFLEVPDTDDVLEVPAPAAVAVDLAPPRRRAPGRAARGGGRRAPRRARADRGAPGRRRPGPLGDADVLVLGRGRLRRPRDGQAR